MLTPNLDLAAEVARLQAAIRQHRDERGDDRCHADDGRLYAVLPEGDTRPARETAVTIENCQRYIECRQTGREYVSPQRVIEELEQDLAKLREAAKAFDAALSSDCDCAERDVLRARINSSQPTGTLSGSIAELARMNYRIVFFPFVGTPHVAYQISVYGDNGPRILYGSVTHEHLAGRLARIVVELKAGRLLVNPTRQVLMRPEPMRPKISGDLGDRVTDSMRDQREL